VKRAVLLAALVLGACGDDGSAMPDAATIDSAVPVTPRETIMSTMPLQVGELVEGTMTGGTDPADIAVITLSAPTPTMGWNIHGHANGGTQVIFEEHMKTTVAYTFDPPTQAEWYLLVRNEGQANMDVTVKVELFGGMQWAWL